MTALPRAEIVRQISVELSQTFAFARSRWAKYAEEVHPELRGIGMMILQMINRRGPITATEITQLLAMDKATVSRQIAKLRELDLISATADPSDRRLIELTATDRAKESLSLLHQQTSEAYRERFASWGSDDLELLRVLLKRFNQNSIEAERANDTTRKR